LRALPGKGGIVYFNAFTARIHVLVRGFFFLPGLLAVLGVLLAVATVAVDRSSIATSLFDYVAFLNISADGAFADPGGLHPGRRQHRTAPS
jgi:hypothetical protein